MSAPPMAITMCTPNSSAITVITISGSMPLERLGICRTRDTEPDHEQQAGQVDPVAPGQQQRLAADLAVQLAECDQRTGEGDCADQDADVDLHLVNGFSAPTKRWIDGSI
jgi:hypothetical protein